MMSVTWINQSEGAEEFSSAWLIFKSQADREFLDASESAPYRLSRPSEHSFEAFYVASSGFEA